MIVNRNKAVTRYAELSLIRNSSASGSVENNEQQRYLSGHYLVSCSLHDVDVKARHEESPLWPSEAGFTFSYVHDNKLTFSA